MLAFSKSITFAVILKPTNSQTLSHPTSFADQIITVTPSSSLVRDRGYVWLWSTNVPVYSMMCWHPQLNHLVLLSVCQALKLRHCNWSQPVRYTSCIVSQSSLVTLSKLTDVAALIITGTHSSSPGGTRDYRKQSPCVFDAICNSIHFHSAIRVLSLRRICCNRSESYHCISYEVSIPPHVANINP